MFNKVDHRLEDVLLIVDAICPCGHRGLQYFCFVIQSAYYLPAYSQILQTIYGHIK